MKYICIYVLIVCFVDTQMINHNRRDEIGMIHTRRYFFGQKVKPLLVALFCDIFGVFTHLKIMWSQVDSCSHVLTIFTKIVNGHQRVEWISYMKLNVADAGESYYYDYSEYYLQWDTLPWLLKWRHECMHFVIYLLLSSWELCLSPLPVLLNQSMKLYISERVISDF